MPKLSIWEKMLLSYYLSLSPWVFEAAALVFASMPFV